MTPQLRFPEFADEWQVKKLGDVLSIGSGRDYKHLKDGNIPVYGTGGLMTHVNDYLYDGKSVAIGRKGTIDQPQFLKGQFWTVDTLFYTHDYKNSVPEFIFLLFQNINWKKWNEASGVPSLSSSTIKSIKVTIPSKPEQEKIADFLTAVDERIRLGEQKLAKLEQYKRGVMQQIFSQKIRFKDENGNEYPDWEEKKLDKFLTIPDRVKAQDIDRNKILTVKLHSKGVTKSMNTETLSLGSTGYYIRKSGQFIYGKQNLFNGAFGIIPNNFEGYLSSGDVPALDINESCNPEFLLYLLSRKTFYKQLEKFASGTGSKRIHEQVLLKIGVKVPQIEEQQKIAAFLTTLDDKITAEKSKLTAAKQFKKALLQRMFV